jgi:hypothetical protein
MKEFLMVVSSGEKKGRIAAHVAWSERMMPG